MFPIMVVIVALACAWAAGCSPKNGPELAPPTMRLEQEEAPLTPAASPPQYSEYSIKLDIQPDKRFVAGFEKIKYINATNRVLDRIYINAPLNAFSEESPEAPVLGEFMKKAYPSGINYGHMKFNSVYADGETVDFSLKGTALTVILPEGLPPGDWTELKLDFEALVPAMNHRTGSDEHSMWFGNFLPRADVCDEGGSWHVDRYYPVGDPFYSRAANFSVSITTPSAYTAAGPGVPAITEKDGKTTYDFSLKLARDFAFAISDRYSESSIVTPSGVEVVFYAFSDAGREEELLDLASRSLEYYSGRAGAYPYSELVIAETRLFNNGGMEYPGIIFMDSGYLNSPGNLASVTHEVGHQWFYNIIGNNPIDNAWMDEGLNSFVQEGFLLEGQALDEKMEAEYAVLKQALAHTTPNTLNSGLGEFTSWGDYYNVHYMRGKLMFYSLHKKIGAEGFNNFLAEYTRRFTFRIATPEDAIQAAEDVSGEDLSSFFDKWVASPEMPPL